MTAGPEVAFALAAREKGKVRLDGGETVTVNRRRKDIKADGRIRLGVAVGYRRIGLSAGYSHGFINYNRNLDGTSRNDYAQLIRFGFSYRLK